MASTPTLQNLISKGGCGSLLPGVSNRSTQVTYYACVLGQLPGTYQGSNAAYKGMSWSALYTRLANGQYSGTDPKTLGDTVLGLYAAQTVGSDVIGTALNTLGTTVNDAGQAAAATFGGSGSGSGSSTCAWNLSIPIVGSTCILTNTQVRAMLAGLVIGVGGIVGIVGLLLVVAEGFQKSGAGHAVGGALETVGAATAFVPGLEGVGLAVGATGAAAKRAGSSSGASASLNRRQSARTARRASSEEYEQEEGS